MTTHFICKLDDIIPETGVCALIEGQQVAIFRTRFDEVFAIDNYDPFSKANVLSRGLVGSTVIETEENGKTISKEVIYVASPIYKQRFDLATGQCLDDSEVKLNSYSMVLEGDSIKIDLRNSEAVA